MNPIEETPIAVTRFLQIMDTLGPPPEDHQTNADAADAMVRAWHEAGRGPNPEVHLRAAIGSNLSAAWSLFNIAILESRHSQDTLDAAPVIALNHKDLMDALPWLAQAVMGFRRSQ
jgi:hypothetical protein